MKRIQTIPTLTRKEQLRLVKLVHGSCNGFSYRLLVIRNEDSFDDDSRIMMSATDNTERELTN